MGQAIAAYLPNGVPDQLSADRALVIAVALKSQKTIHATNRMSDLPLRVAQPSNFQFGARDCGLAPIFTPRLYSDHLEKQLLKALPSSAMMAKSRRLPLLIAFAQLTGVNGSQPVSSLITGSSTNDGYLQTLIKLAEKLDIKHIDVSQHRQTLARALRSQLEQLSGNRLIWKHPNPEVSGAVADQDWLTPVSLGDGLEHL